MPERIRRSPLPPSQCNLARCFELLGDRWTLLILRSALYGVCRFDDFQAELSIPRAVLSRRLKELVEAGLMRPQEYREPGKRRRTEYRLTDMGQGLRLPFLAMTQWGDRWLGGDRQPPLVLQSGETGRRVRVALVDEQDNVVDSQKLRVKLTGRR